MNKKFTRIVAIVMAVLLGLSCVSVLTYVLGAGLI